MGQSFQRLALASDLVAEVVADTLAGFDPYAVGSDVMNCVSDQIQPSPSSLNSHNVLDNDSDENDIPQKAVDLTYLPPELALSVLSHLKATDLCLAACVWQQLATDEILWKGLCKEQWPEASVYRIKDSNPRQGMLSYRKIYLLLDEATLTFNSDPYKGMQYLFSHGLVENHPYEIAKFFHLTSTLVKSQMRIYLQNRHDVVQCMMAMQNYTKDFLPNALRKCFAKLEAPNDRGRYLQDLLESFSTRFCQCNPDLGHTVDSVYVMCFSLILLSVDLSSPHVKNKMSKREFIRNTRNALTQFENRNKDELYGEMYDNVFLHGHVSEEGKRVQKPEHQFVPGYLALFL